MASARTGPWSRNEIEAIVADYLDMLQLDLRGARFVKAQRNRALQNVIGRSRASIEFKHRNISAVMERLGLPYVTGYVPARNYQRALYEVVEERLVKTGLHERVANQETATDVPASGIIYQGVPDSLPEPPRLDDEVRRIITRFDPAERDARARALGRAGEEFVYRSERNRLAACGRDDLASKVRWVARDDGDGAGFDILSFSTKGAEQWLEVKTTNGPAATPFWITENERRVSEQNPDEFRLTRLHDFSRLPAAFQIKPPLTDHIRLDPSEYRATLLPLR